MPLQRQSSVVKHSYEDYPSGSEKIAEIRIRYKDVFIMKYIYFYMHEWFIEKGYCKREDDPSFGERFYQQRDMGDMKELLIRWRLSKEPVGSEGTGWRYDFYVDTIVIGLKDFETVAAGKKVKAQTGDIDMWIRAWLVVDPNHEWDANPFLKPFKNLYFRKLKKKTFEMHKNLLYREVYEFSDALKNYLKVRPYFEEGEARKFYSTKDFE